MHSASASYTYLIIVQVWPDWPGANLLDVSLIRGAMDSLSIYGRLCCGCCGGSSWKVAATCGSVFVKNLCDSRLATSSWAWTRPSGLHNEGTLETLQPCLHLATSHSSAFSICSFTQLCLAAQTVPLSQADATPLVAVALALHRFCVANAHAAFHYGAAFGW